MANVLEAVIRGRDELSGAVGTSLKSLDSMAGRVTALSTSFLALQQVGGIAIRAISGVITELSGFERAARQLGVTTDEVQRLSFAAEQAGNTMEGFIQPVQMLQDRLPQLDKQLRALGIRQEEIRDKSPTQVLVRLAEAFEDVESQTLKTQLAMDLFGRSGRQVLADLAEGADTLRENFAKAPLIPEQTIKDAEKLGDLINTINVNTLAFVVQAFSEPYQAMRQWWLDIAGAVATIRGGGHAIAFGARPSVPGVGARGVAGSVFAEIRDIQADRETKFWAELLKETKEQTAEIKKSGGLRDLDKLLAMLKPYGIDERNAMRRFAGMGRLTPEGLPILTEEQIIPEREITAAERAIDRLADKMAMLPAKLSEAWDHANTDMQFALAESIVYGTKWSEAMGNIIDNFRVRIIQMILDVAQQAIISGFLRILAGAGISAVTGGAGGAAIGTAIGGGVEVMGASRVRVPTSGLAPGLPMGGVMLNQNIQIRAVYGSEAELRQAVIATFGAARQLGLA